jgi:Na+/phosphate symporter
MLPGGAALMEAANAAPASRRLPIGNLAFRAIGCVVALPFAHPIAEALWQISPNPAAAVVDFHIACNLALAVVFVGLLDPAARTLTRAMPERSKKDGRCGSAALPRGIGVGHAILGADQRVARSTTHGGPGGRQMACRMSIHGAMVTP